MKCYVCNKPLTGNFFRWRYQTVQTLCSEHFFKAAKMLTPEIHEEINEPKRSSENKKV